MSSEILGVGVDNHLELHTTIFGWLQYEQVWSLLAVSGLIYLPFLGILIRTLTTSLRSQKGTDTSFATLRRVEFDVLRLLILIVIVGQPLIPLKMEQLTFTRFCVYDGQTFTRTKTIKASDDLSQFRRLQLSEENSARVPAWWYAVMTISSGVTHAAKQGIPCPDDILAARFALKTFEFKNDQLMAEIENFITDCFLPTRAYVLFGYQRDPSGWSQVKYDQLIGRYGQGDINWIGSKVFLQMPGKYFYQQRMSRRQVTDTSGETQRLTCAKWWNRIYDALVVELKDAPFDLQKFIEQHRDKQYFGRFSATNHLSVDEQLNIAVKIILGKTIKPTHISESLNILVPEQKPHESFNVLLEKFYANMASFGAAWRSLVDYPMTHAIKEGAPAAIALLSMALYFMLPIGLIFSSFSLQFIIAAAVGIFTIKFTSYLFYLAAWLNQNLHALLGTEGLDSLESQIFSLVVNGLYLILPLMFVTMMGWAGINLSVGLSNAFDKLGGENSVLAEGARAGGRLAQSVVRSTYSRTYAFGDRMLARGAAAAGRKMTQKKAKSKKNKSGGRQNQSQ